MFPARELLGCLTHVTQTTKPGRPWIYTLPLFLVISLASIQYLFSLSAAEPSHLFTLCFVLFFASYFSQISLLLFFPLFLSSIFPHRELSFAYSLSNLSVLNTFLLTKKTNFLALFWCQCCCYCYHCKSDTSYFYSKLILILLLRSHFTLLTFISL